MRAADDATLFDFQPDVVMHLAAESHVDRSIDGPAEFIQTNVVGTFTLLRGAGLLARAAERQGGAFRFHHISTDEVFGSLGAGALPRGRPTAQLALLGVKAASDHLVRAGTIPMACRCSDELLEQLRAVSFPRKADPAGDHECARRQAAAGLRHRSDVRDWLYVEDHVRALLLVAKQGASAKLQCRRPMRADQCRGGRGFAL